MDSARGGDAPSSADPRSKVGRILAAYDFEHVGAELERRWIGDGEVRTSLRDLADDFNRLVLEAALERTGTQPIDGEVDNLYRLLTGDDVGTAATAQAEAKLSGAGIDVDALRQDFVSHQAIHTYLTDYREVGLPDRERQPEKPAERRAATIERLRNRLRAVTERSLQSLCDAGHLSEGPFDVLVNVSVYCEGCETTTDISSLLEGEGCECQQ